METPQRRLVVSSLVIVMLIAVGGVFFYWRNSTGVLPEIAGNAGLAPEISTSTSATSSATVVLDEAANSEAPNSKSSATQDKETLLCFGAVQHYIYDLRQSSVKLNPSGDLQIPVWNYEVLTSQYNQPKKSCYAVIHGYGSSLQPAGKINLDTYGLYVDNQPQGWDRVESSLFLKVAGCFLQTAPTIHGYGNPVSCEYYGAKQSGSMNLWAQEFPGATAKFMSYEDFKALVSPARLPDLVR